MSERNEGFWTVVVIAILAILSIGACFAARSDCESLLREARTHTDTLTVLSTHTVSNYPSCYAFGYR